MSSRKQMKPALSQCQNQIKNIIKKTTNNYRQIMKRNVKILNKIIAKQNPRKYKQLYITRGIYYRYTNVQHLKNQYNPPYQQAKEEKLYDPIH